MARKAFVVFSGGPDSTAAALWAVESGYEVELLTFQFGTPEQYGELRGALQVASQLNLPHKIVDFKAIVRDFSSEVRILMHAGTPADLGPEVDKTKPHLMPFGAGMILATAANYAVYNRAVDLIWGATEDDGANNNYEYTSQFATDFSKIISNSIRRQFLIHVPFATLGKHRVFEAFRDKEQLFATTWSCKVEERVQCGSCAACIARRVAATVSEVPDSTPYVSTPELPFTSDELGNFDHISLKKKRASVMPSEGTPRP